MIKAIGLTLALMTFPMMAMAQQPCMPRDKAIVFLAESWGESLQIQALMAPENTILEIYANTDTGTWTAVSVNTNNVACRVASGENWTAVNSPVPPKGIDG